MWRIGQIKKYYSQNAYIDIYDVLRNETEKIFVPGTIYRQIKFPEINSLVGFKRNGEWFRKLEHFNQEFIDLNFHEFNYDLMEYIDSFQSNLISEKFNKLLFEKEKHLLRLKDILLISDIELNKKNFEQEFLVETSYSDYNKVGDDFSVNMSFILTNPNFNKFDLYRLAEDSHKNWSILSYKTSGSINFEYINKMKNSDYSIQKIEILNKVKTNFQLNYYVVDKWKFSQQSNYLNSEIKYKLDKNGFNQTFNNLSSIIESFVGNTNEYFEFERKLFKMDKL